MCGIGDHGHRSVSLILIIAEGKHSLIDLILFTCLLPTLFDEWNTLIALCLTDC